MMKNPILPNSLDPFLPDTGYTAEGWTFEYLRQAIDAIPDSIYILDTRFVIQAVNSSARRRINLSADQIIGKEIMQFLDKDLVSRRMKDNLPLLAKKKPFVMVDELDGQKNEIHVTPILDGTGEIQNILVVARGITKPVHLEESLHSMKADLNKQINAQNAKLLRTNLALQEEIQRRQEIENAMRASESRYRTLVESSPYAIAQISIDGVLEFCNPTSATMLGYENPEEMIGKPISYFINPEDRERAFHNIRASVPAGFIYGNEYNFLRKDGSLVPVRSGAAFIKNPGSSPTSFIGILIDITEQRAYDDRIRQQSARNEALVKAALTASAATNLEDVLTTICEQAAKTLSAPTATIRYLNRENNTLDLVAGYGLPDGYMEKERVMPYPPFQAFIEGNDQKVVVVEMQEIPSNPTDRLPHRTDLKSVVITKIYQGGFFEGVLVVPVITESKYLSLDELSFLEALADLASIAAEKNRLFEQLTQRAQEMERLANLSLGLRHASSQANMTPAMLEGIMMILSADSGVFIKTLKGMPTIIAGRGDRNLDPPSPITPDSCIHNLLSSSPQYLKSGASISQGVDPTANKPEQYPFLASQTQSIAVLPLNSSDHVSDWIVLGFNQPREFTETERHVMISFMEIASNALQRAQIMENLEDRVTTRTKALRTLFEIAALLNASSELEPVLQETLKKTLPALNACAGAIHLKNTDQNKLDCVQQLGLPPECASNFPCSIGIHNLWQVLLKRDNSLSSSDADSYTDEPVDIPNHPECKIIPVPIRSRGELLGMITVMKSNGANSPSIDQFSEDDLVVLAAIADQVGVAVERARLSQLAEETVKVEERQRLARDLHDAILQSLYSINLLAEGYRRQLKMMESEAETTTAKMSLWLDDISSTAQQAMKEMRLLLYELRPTALEQDGLAGALSRRLETVEKRANVQSKLNVKGNLRLPPREEEEVYRIAQEALNNALKHAHHSRVDVSLTAEENSFELEIIDDGQGFSPEIAANQSGMGLGNMKTRAERIDGSLSILSAPGMGCRILFSKELAVE